ncbi:hypothetical protein CDL12_16071 [Handroanthus impetiginosus]|uniref:Uncharacterized protein n=1 Tax=Handroanthus impetiginosus TaxID=429701 RepID=A0A2G9H1C9_9LAMI|nr:hypothetical protein CDL12_16071 [Handroanthus impetiginosus]
MAGYVGTVQKVDQRTNDFHHSTFDQDASLAPIHFPFNNFKYCLTIFSMFFSLFPCSTCWLSISHLYLALDEIYHPIGAAFSNNLTHGNALWPDSYQARWGSHPSSLNSLSKDLDLVPHITDDVSPLRHHFIGIWTWY